MGKRGEVPLTNQLFFDLRAAVLVWRSETINIGISKYVTKGTRWFNGC